MKKIREDGSMKELLMAKYKGVLQSDSTYEIVRTASNEISLKYSSLGTWTKKGADCCSLVVDEDSDSVLFMDHWDNVEFRLSCTQISSLLLMLDLMGKSVEDYEIFKRVNKPKK